MNKRKNAVKENVSLWKLNIFCERIDNLNIFIYYDMDDLNPQILMVLASNIIVENRTDGRLEF